MITLIAAIDNKRCIGRNNTLPWRQRSDLLSFKETTMGKIVVMGRRTLESMHNKPLYGRTNIVLTTSARNFIGCVTAKSVDHVLSITQGYELFIIGGSTVFEQFMPLARRILLTEIDTETDGCDTYFPIIQDTMFKRTSCKTYDADEGNQYGYTYTTYMRKDNYHE